MFRRRRLCDASADNYGPRREISTRMSNPGLRAGNHAQQFISSDEADYFFALKP
jgi:hypothetical protein